MEESLQEMKPPLGARPYWVAAKERINELCEAIIRADPSQNYSSIRKWAEEIIQQCDLIEWLGE